MKLFGVLCLLVVVGLSSAFPRSRYYPRSYMVGGSYYANPRYVREGPGYEYLPPGQMTAMVVGDTVATNSFSGSPYDHPVITQVDEEQVITDQVTEKQQPILVQEPDSINETEPEELAPEPEQHVNDAEQETLFSIEDATTEAVAVSTTKATPVAPSKAPVAAKKGKAGKPKRPSAVPVALPQPAEEDEEEESGSAGAWPFAGAGRAGLPNYNAFFPIFIGGGSPSGRARTRSNGAGEDSYPGSATAIANSFSTGKGGVATSHATSFGDPYAAAMLRNAGLFNFRTKNNKKQTIQLEDEE